MLKRTLIGVALSVILVVIALKMDKTITKIDESKPPQVINLINTTTTEAPATTTTTSTTTTMLPVRNTIEPEPLQACWVDVAYNVGWPKNTLSYLGIIIQRESNCDPTAHADRPSTNDDSWGLLQINTIGNLWPAVQSLCSVSVKEQLTDPVTNLSCGLALYNKMGWRPWGG